MNPTAIYSKSGKGVQEASGKTSLLARPDRAVLSAIDGRATLADVAQKCGKTFDNAFQDLVAKLDKDGFVREVSPGVAPPAAKAAPGAKAASGAKPAGKAESSGGGGGDLDFSSLGVPSRPAAAPPPPPQRPAAPPPRPTPPPPPPKPAAPPKPDPSAEAAAKAQQSALQKAREEAEAKADAERQRVKAEAEAKMRAEMESKARSEAEKKMKEEAERKAREEADAKVKAAQQAAAKAAAEAKAKADAEAKAKVEAERKAREETERRLEAERKAREEAERKAKEEAERVRKQLEAERKAREEAERKAKEEAERARKQLEEERRKMEEERKREEQERAARRKREEEEEAERRRKRDEEERRHEEERAARRKRQDEEDELERSNRMKARQAEPEAAAAPPPPPKASSAGGGLDSLMADLDSFTTREEEARKEKEEAERKEKQEAERRAREQAERQAKEEAERREKEEARERKAEEKRRKKEEEEELSRKREKEEARLREEEEKRKREAEERERKAKREEVLTAQATRQAVHIGEDTDQVRKRMMGKRGAAAEPVAAVPRAPARKGMGLGKLIALALVVLLAIGGGYLHIMPLSTAEYERAASEAMGAPVKIGSINLSLVTGLQLKAKDVRIGDDTRIPLVIAVPEFEALRGERKAFSRIEFDGAKLPQDAVGAALLARVKADNFSVERVVVHRLELTGGLPLPQPLDAELVYGGDGTLRSATLRGPDTLVARITPTANAIEFEVTASGFPLPMVSDLTLSSFSMKGTANRRGMAVSEWGGKLYGGGISGTANVRWGGNWTIEGVVTARNINAAVFAPALLSEGKGEGTGRFSMTGTDPAKLGDGGHLEGSFTISGGILGSFDLSRAIKSSGKEATGRTQFTELSGQAVYDRGSIALRNVSITAGALNAGASADIAPGGALSGRIVADVKTAGRSQSATLNLSGTVKEPQVRN